MVAVVVEDPEQHYMLKSIILRPLILAPVAEGDGESRQLRIIETYKQLCTPGARGEEWPALHGGPDSPGPFQRGFEAFLVPVRRLADDAERKSLQGPCPRWPSLWETAEAQHTLEQLAAECEDGDALAVSPRDPALAHGAAPPQARISVSEYCAMVTMRVAANFDGIAKARSEKPKRQIDQDRLVKEAPLHVEGGGDDGTADVQVEGAEARARLGFGAVGQSMHSGQRLSKTDLD